MSENPLDPNTGPTTAAAPRWAPHRQDLNAALAKFFTDTTGSEDQDAAQATCHRIARLVSAAVGAALSSRQAILAELVTHLVTEHQGDGVAHAVGVLARTIAEFTGHQAAAGCTVGVAGELPGEADAQRRSALPQAIKVATELLSGVVTRDGLRWAAGLAALTPDLFEEVLLLLITRLRDLIESAAAIQGDAYSALDEFYPQQTQVGR